MNTRSVVLKSFSLIEYCRMQQNWIHPLHPRTSQYVLNPHGGGGPILVNSTRLTTMLEHILGLIIIYNKLAVYTLLDCLTRFTIVLTRALSLLCVEKFVKHIRVVITVCW